MKTLFTKRVLALFLSLFYFTTQVVLASVAESNIWAERRKAIEPSSTPRINASTPQLASLPALFNQLPSIGSALTNPTPKWTDLTKPNFPKLSVPLQELTKAIPLTHATIQDIYDSPPSPENGFGGAAPVLLIQDVHLNTEAQTNIAEILQELITQ